MTRTIIKNLHTIVTMDNENRILHDTDIVIKDKEIETIGVLQSGQEQADIELNGHNLIALPGLINIHHHLYQTLQRNVPLVQNAELFDWLTNLYEIWQELTPAEIEVSTQVGLAELLLTGCTTTSDHFYVFPRSQPTTLIDEEIRVAAEMGMRFHPTRGSMSVGQSKGGLPPDDVVQSESAIMADYDRLVSLYHDETLFSMCRLSLAPCSPFSVSPELMRETASYARAKHLRLHTHLAETLDEQAYCLERFGKRPLAYMEEVGWLGQDVWFAHGIHFNDQELDTLAQTSTGIAHCPTSNLRLGSGIARVPEMRQKGIVVGIGVDGSASNDSSNMLRELQMTLLIHRVTQGTNATDAPGVFEMATRSGAAILGREEIGQLAQGKAADIILFDLNQIGLAGAWHDPVAALLFCGTSQQVHSSMVNGKLIIHKGQFLSFDEEKVIYQANQLAAKMIQRASIRTGKNYLKRSL